MRTTALAFLTSFLFISAGSSAAGIRLGPADAPTHGVDPGELLLGELNCTACHAPEASVQERLFPNQAPILGVLAYTPQFLRSFLESPHAAKPGTRMPDLLHGLAESERGDAVEALTHYLIGLQRSETNAPTGSDAFRMRQGRTLFHQVGCAACHAPQEPAADLDPGAADGSRPPRPADPGFESSSAPLGNLAQKYSVPELTRFLLDPLKTRPGGRMPSLNLSEGEATAIAMYLLRTQAPGMLDPAVPMRKIQGLSYQYFEGGFDQEPDFDKLKVVDTGFAENFTLSSKRRESNIGFRFSGFVRIPADGNYTFYTFSDDGSRLYLGDRLIVQNDGMHAAAEKKGEVTLKAGDHPIVVTWYNGGGEFVLKVSYEGPGLTKQEIPASALSHLGQPMSPIGDAPFVRDAAKAAHGRQHFVSMGCAACHQTTDPNAAPLRLPRPLAKLGEGAKGCLAENIQAGLPRYDLSEAQRGALLQALTNPERLREKLSPAGLTARTLVAMNCVACHSRDGKGGPSMERAEYFHSLGEADLGDEGRIPPHLTQVGGKLRPEWIRQVLAGKGSVRPYMATRMPAFGESNVASLAAAFEAAEHPSSSAAEPEYSARDAKLGRKLVGQGGLSCISCHTFAQYKSLGIPAMNLTQMAHRLKKSWFDRYLIDPASLRPGTRMPSFWPEGKAVNEEVLGGDTAAQINAIWMYLSRGSEADVPPGLIQGKMEIVAKDEAVIYRHFIQGAGSRAIAVAYPEKANLAFDANQLRLAMIWQGSFIDAARHTSGRGEGFEPPLGNNVIQMPAGPAFAVLADPASPWPEISGRKGGYRMRGYRLDDKRRPTFLYSFQQIEIEDFPEAVAGELDPALHRTLLLKSSGPVENVWFRAAAGSRIENRGNSWLIDGRLTMTLSGANGGTPIVREAGGKQELLFPVIFRNGEARISQQLVW